MSRTKSEQHDMKLVNVQQMARILGVAETWLYERTRHGPKAIPQVRLGKYVRFRPNEVVKFFEGQQGGGARRR